MWEIAKSFRFEAAHTLCRAVDGEASSRIHGHSYRAKVTIRGVPDPATGMIVDLGAFERALMNVRELLDHRFLDEVSDLGPATLENLCTFIWERVARDVSGLAKVTVHRDSQGESSSYLGPTPT